MPVSEYVRSIRASIDHALLLLPAVTAVIIDGRGRYLLARHADGRKWGFVGGGIEPNESPRAALAREVREELSIPVEIIAVIDSYGGPELAAIYANGDRVSYVTTAYLCRADTRVLTLERDELLEARWFEPEQIEHLDRFEWIDAVIVDALRLSKLFA